jgi:hypothetical protein
MLLTSLVSRVFIASLCALSFSASAHRPLPLVPVIVPAPPAGDTTDSTGTFANLQVRDRDSGAVLPIYRHNGRLYVAGTPGRRYGISLRNQLDTRGLLVVSVDGVNALTGETADYSQAGYVLQSGQAYEVKGWRKSTREVAAFTFTALPDSYAARTGRPQDVGAIGIAVFREAYVRPTAAPAPYMDEQRAEARSAPSASGQAQNAPPMLSKRAEKLGTGHGEREASVVERTSFERAHSTPDEVITIYYDSRANLIAQGVIREPSFGSMPRPFPAQPIADTRNFVPDPHLR